jgi:hypothetical protein
MCAHSIVAQLLVDAPNLSSNHALEILERLLLRREVVISFFNIPIRGFLATLYRTVFGVFGTYVRRLGYPSSDTQITVSGKWLAKTPIQPIAETKEVTHIYIAGGEEFVVRPFHAIEKVCAMDMNIQPIRTLCYAILISPAKPTPILSNHCMLKGSKSKIPSTVPKILNLLA